LALAFVLMGLALVFSNPPGASPDEAAHYLRAAAAGRGQIDLDRIDIKPATPRITWLQMQSGKVLLPERLSPVAFDCWSRPDFVGTCDHPVSTSDRAVPFETYVGTYPPLAYLIPGLLMRAADGASAAMILGRIGSLLFSLILISAAVLALHDRRSRLYLAGVVCSVTPMVLFLSASLSSSGAEVAAAICFFACLLRISRAGTPGWVWVAAATSGAALALVRDLGPGWVALELGLVGVFGFGRLRQSFKEGGRIAWGAAGTLVAALAGALAWQSAEAVRPDLSLLEPASIDLAYAGGLARQAVGVFGPLDALMPEPAYLLWGILVFGLVVAALLSGTIPQKLTLVLAILATGVVTYGLEAVQNIYGFGVQARHELPAVVCVTLLAGEMVARGPRPRWAGSSLVVPGLVISAATVHLTAWFTVGRRFAVGVDGPVIFFTAPAWSPPGGWIAWGTVMGSACLLMTLPFLRTLRKE
jgi:hypothetical protein